jgi:hypothetical protein
MTEASAQFSSLAAATPRSAAGLRDHRADGGERDVTLTRQRVTIRRRYRGVGMKIAVPTQAYRGVVLSLEEGARGRAHFRVTLRHDDPDLSVILTEAFDETQILADWRAWADFLTQRPLVERDGGALEQADSQETASAQEACMEDASFPVMPRRRGTPATWRSRGRFQARRRVGGAAENIGLHKGEREIVCYE